MKRGYGCLLDIEDERDKKYLFRVAAPDLLVLTSSHALSPWFPPAMNQGQYGTCTAHGATAALRYDLIVNDLPDLLLSRSQPYWDAGVIEGDTADVGRQIRDMLKAIAAKGACLESEWGYDMVGHEPPQEVYSSALRHAAIEYCRVPVDRASINTAIYVGHPVIIGVPVFASFESDEVAETGFVPMPKANETEVGMHCMLMGDYDPQYDNVLNSWGAGWGQAGYCKLPRGYLEKYGSDFWTILINR
jgi:C1A family cysteine protease